MFNQSQFVISEILRWGSTSRFWENATKTTSAQSPLWLFISIFMFKCRILWWLYAV